jgi:hypothetical protein
MNHRGLEVVSNQKKTVLASVLCSTGMQIRRYFFVGRAIGDMKMHEIA